MYAEITRFMFSRQKIKEKRIYSLNTVDVKSSADLKHHPGGIIPVTPQSMRRPSDIVRHTPFAGNKPLLTSFVYLSVFDCHIGHNYPRPDLKYTNAFFDKPVGKNGRSHAESGL